MTCWVMEQKLILTLVSILKVVWLSTIDPTVILFFSKMCGFTEPVALTPTEAERGMRGMNRTGVT